MNQADPRVDFVPNLLRAVAAELHYANLLRLAVEKYGRPLSQLSEEEQSEVGNSLVASVATIARVLTPEILASLGSMGARIVDAPASGKPQ